MGEASVKVAFDVGPLAGRRTGIGAGVAALHDALVAMPRLELTPYLLSFRARPQPGVVRLPFPAALAHRCWARADRPRVDRWLTADVIHGTNYVVPPARIPRLVSVYDCWFLRHPTEAHPDVVRAGRVLRRQVAGGAVVHASSHATADALSELMPGAEVRVVHLAPLPLPEPAPRCPIAELDGRPFVLSVATIERRKNLPALVRAFGLVGGGHPDLRLVLAGGDGDDRAEVDAAIDTLPRDLAARVVLTGYVTDPVRGWLLRHARALAYPSWDEGFGFPLLDAMGSDLPIVASRAGSIPEVAGDAASLVDPADVEGLAEAIGRVVVDDELRQRMIGAGRRRYGELTWEATAAGVGTVLSELASRKGRS